MEDHNTVFIGLDVHKDTIAVAIAEGGPMGEVRPYGTVGGDLNSVEKLVGKFRHGSDDAMSQRFSARG